MKSKTRMAVSLACTVCGSRNYRTSRPVREGAAVLELKKHCPLCNSHTLHRETK